MAVSSCLYKTLDSGREISTRAPLSPPRVPLFACGPGLSHPSLKVSGRDCMLLGGQGGEILGMEMPETATVMSRVDEVISVCGWLGKG